MKKRKVSKQIIYWFFILMFTLLISLNAFKFISAIPHLVWWEVLLILLTFVLSFPLHIILHELGHLVAGLLSGYQFIMFRLFSWVWIQTEEGISRRKQLVPGLLGQALMVPPEYVDEPPMLFYHAGGLIVNCLTALLMFLFSWQSPSVFTSLMWFISASVALILVLMNTYPQRGTDGYNILQLHKQPETAAEITNILRLYGGMVRGESFVDLKRFISSETINDFRNPNHVTLYTALAAAYFEQNEFEKAYRVYHHLWKKRGQLLQLHKPEVYMSYLFSLFLTHPEHEDVQTIKNTNIYQQAVETKAVDSYKIHAAEAIFVEGNSDKATRYLDEGEKLISTAPTVSEEKLEAHFYTYLRKEIARLND